MKVIYKSNLVPCLIYVLYYLILRSIVDYWDYEAVPKEEYEIFWAILAIHHAMFVSDTISINKIRRFLLAYNHKTTYFNEY